MPTQGEVHIWAAPLDHAAGELARLEGLLSREELIRAGRLLTPQGRNRFVAGRGFLRKTLGRYLGVGGEQVCLGVGEHGKPHLSGEQAGSGLRFNLSHAEELALLAVSGDREVGIDLERVRETLEFRGMAERFLSPQEQAELFSHPPEGQLSAFFRCWTRKEAYLKARGHGFSQPDPDCGTGGWSLVDLTVPEGYCAALAVEGAMPVLRYF